MAEHYTKNTAEATAWCKKCSDFTQHAVTGGRLSYCMACMQRLENEPTKLTKDQEARRKKEEHDRRNPTLFQD